MMDKNELVCRQLHKIDYLHSTRRVGSHWVHHILCQRHWSLWYTNLQEIPAALRYTLCWFITLWQCKVNSGVIMEKILRRIMFSTEAKGLYWNQLLMCNTVKFKILTGRIQFFIICRKRVISNDLHKQCNPYKPYSQWLPIFLKVKKINFEDF